MRNSLRKEKEKKVLSGRLARSRKSGPGGPEVVHKKLDKELSTEIDAFK